MESLIVNRLTADGMREVKLCSDAPVTLRRMYRFVPTPALDSAEVRVYDTSALRIFYGEARWGARDPMEFCLPGWVKPRRLLVWKLSAGQSVREALEEARVYFFQLTMRHPQFAFMRRVPKLAEVGFEQNGVMLVECEWAVDGCLLLGKGVR
jgi:hypothetical protein